MCTYMRTDRYVCAQKCRRLLRSWEGGRALGAGVTGTYEMIVSTGIPNLQEQCEPSPSKPCRQLLFCVSYFIPSFIF